MVELTDREKKIVMIKFIMHGVGPYQDLPVDDREKHLIAAIQLLGFQYNKEEMLDLGEGILAVQQQMINSAMGFVNMVPKDQIQNALRYAQEMFKRK